MTQDWKISNKREVLNQGKFLRVEYHTVELPDGTVIDDWSWVITPDYVNIVVITEDGRFLLFKQGKYAYKGVSFAPMGGYLEPGEDALEAAKRELLEETGYVADDWSHLGKWVVDSNRGAGTAHAYLAIGARKVQARAADDLEEQTIIHLNRDEVEAALLSGKVKVLPWSNALLMALMLYDKRMRDVKKVDDE